MQDPSQDGTFYLHLSGEYPFSLILFPDVTFSLISILNFSFLWLQSSKLLPEVLSKIQFERIFNFSFMLLYSFSILICWCTTFV